MEARSHRHLSVFLVLYVWQALFVKPVPKPAGTTSAGRRPRARQGSAAAPAVVAPGSRRPQRLPPPLRLRLGRDAPRRQRERDVRVETQRRHRGVHEPRRAAEELAAEALSRISRSSRRSSSRPRPRSRCPSRSARRSRRSTQTVNGALYASGGSAPVVTSRRHRLALRVSRQRRRPRRQGRFTSIRRRIVVERARQRGTRRSPGARHDRLGSGARRRRRDDARYAAGRGLLFQDGSVAADAERHRQAADSARATSSTPASTTTTS